MTSTSPDAPGRLGQRSGLMPCELSPPATASGCETSTTKPSASSWRTCAPSCLESGAPTVDPSRDSAEVQAPTLPTVEGLLKDLPLAQKEIFFFKLAGYSDATLERILLIPPAAIRKPLEGLEGDYGTLLTRQDDACPWPAAWVEVLRRARAAHREDCPSRRVFIRILDGQTTWYEKSPAEEHMARCLHCLEFWVALREVSYWRRVATPLSSADVKGFLLGLPIDLAVRPSSLLKRLFSL